MSHSASIYRHVCNFTDDGSLEVLERGTSRLTSSTVSKTTSRSGRAKKGVYIHVLSTSIYRHVCIISQMMEAQKFLREVPVD